MPEVNQAIGSRTHLIYALEEDYGVLNEEPNWKALRLVGGETLDDNIAIYRSQQIRSDRMQSASVRGTQRPGGQIPFELSPKGWLPFLWHLLKGEITTTGSGQGNSNPPFTHVIKGSVGPETSFSLEKGFLDLDDGESGFFLFLGCKVNSMTLNIGIDQIWSGVWDIIGREMMEPSEESASDGATLVVPTEDPFTSSQIVISEGSTLDVLGIVESLSLTINNQYREDRGFVVGSNLRANAKPGTRLTTGTMNYMFKDSSMYEKAKTGESTKLRIVGTSGPYSITFDLPKIKFLPNGSVPKITDDGAVSGTVNFEALPDSTEGTDVKVTLVVPEEAIND